MTKITSALAIALIASASFASAALAEGGYYNGGTEPSVGMSVPASKNVDRATTGSIVKAQRQDAKQAPADLSHGDYYDGANRPN